MLKFGTIVDLDDYLVAILYY